MQGSQKLCLPELQEGTYEVGAEKFRINSSASKSFGRFEIGSDSSTSEPQIYSGLRTPGLRRLRLTSRCEPCCGGCSAAFPVRPRGFLISCRCRRDWVGAGCERDGTESPVRSAGCSVSGATTAPGPCSAVLGRRTGFGKTLRGSCSARSTSSSVARISRSSPLSQRSRSRRSVPAPPGRLLKLANGMSGGHPFTMHRYKHTTNSANLRSV